MDAVTITWAALVGAPIVSGVVQAIKLTQLIPNRFLPLISIGVGTLLGSVAGVVSNNPLLIVSGLTSGLGAVGVYNALTQPMRVETPDEELHP